MATSTQKRRSRQPGSRRQAPHNFPKRTSRSAVRYATFLLWVAIMAIAGSRGGLESGSSVVFWLVLSLATVHLVAEAMRSQVAASPVRRMRAAVLLLTVAAAVVVFDPVTLDTFNVTKVAVVVVGAAALLALAGVEWAMVGRFPALGNALQWPVLALLAWNLVATAASSDVRLSLLGVYGSYNGLLSVTALVVVFFFAARTFRMDQLARVLSVIWFSIGGVVMFYGFLQLHDRLWGGQWDWVQWGTASFLGPVWSTLGNPNHLAGLLAILLPVGIVLGALATHPIRRVLIVVMGVILLLELLYTEGRGGWLGAGLGLGVLALTWLPELRRRPRAVFGGVMALAVVLTLSIALLGDEVNLGGRVASAFDLSEGTTAQRIGQWEAAVEMTREHPLTGVGPEAFRIQFNRYQPADFVEQFGAHNTTASSHNVFTDHAAMLGLPGLALFLWLVVAAGRRSVAAWREIRRREAADEPVAGVDPRSARLMLGGVAAALVAFLAQSSFNVQQVALWAMFWVLLALLAVVARATEGEEPVEQPAATSARRRHSGTLVAATAVVAAAAVIAVAIFSTMPWRADRHYRNARIARNVAAGQLDDPQARLLLDRSAAEFQRAIDLNSWEPVYRSGAGQLELFRASRADELGIDAVAAAESAVASYRRAVELRPEAFELLDGYGDALLALYTVTPAGDVDALREAVRVTEMALERNPHSVRLQDKLEDARRLLERESD